MIYPFQVKWLCVKDLSTTLYHVQPIKHYGSGPVQRDHYQCGCQYRDIPWPGWSFKAMLWRPLQQPLVHLVRGGSASTTGNTQMCMANTETKKNTDVSLIMIIYCFKKTSTHFCGMQMVAPFQNESFVLKNPWLFRPCSQRPLLKRNSWKSFKRLSKYRSYHKH